MKKRVFSLFMALALCLSMAPTVSFAEGTGGVAEQGAQSGGGTDVYTTDVDNDTNNNGVSGGDMGDANVTGTTADDVNTCDAYVSGGDVNADDVNADEQDAEKNAAVEAAQSLIDALPDEATAENADELQTQLIAIDKALAELTDEQIARLDMTRYENLCAALNGLVAVQAEHDHPICGTTCNHEGEAHQLPQNETWTPINSADQLQSNMAAGYYYLENNIELTGDTWRLNYGQNIVLCLNGHSITMKADKDVIAVTLGTFTLCDCKGSGTITHGTKDGTTTYTGTGVSVGGGIFNMYGGTISGNSAGLSGGGVYVVYGSSVFNMYGGTITKNSASSGGGGVSVEYGTFNMYDGTISENTTDGSGGGVDVSSGSFIMNGGNISTNNAGTYGGGGGVNVTYGGSFTMQGGKISSNMADCGGGVCVENYYGKNNTFTMQGGEITDNTATATKQTGGGVFVREGNTTFTVAGAVRIKGNHCTKNPNVEDNVYLVNNNSETIKIAGKLTGGKGSIGVTMLYTPNESEPNTLATADNYELVESDAKCFSSDQGYAPFFMDKEVKMFVYEPQMHPICGKTCIHDGKHPDVLWIGVSKLSNIDAEGNYYLVNDISSNGDSLSNTYDVNLCLHGHTHSGGLLFQRKNYTLCDCTGKGKITGSTTQYGGIRLISGGKLDMYGGTVTGNNMGAYVDNGTFNMYGGEITGNTYEGVDGSGNYGGVGGVRVDEDSIFNMSGSAKVSNNTARFSGKGDTYDSGYYGAAGVYVNGGTFTMTENAEVSGNTLTTENIGEGANNYAGGVYVRNNTSSKVTVGGDVKITGNMKNGNSSNVCLPKGQTIKVSGKLNENAIGVITETPITVVGEETVIAEGTDGYTLTSDDKNSFSSDDNIPAELENGKIIFRKGVHKHYICGEANCSDSHGTNEKWTAISTLSEINGDGYYFLTKDVELNGTWVCNDDVKLCLNGKTITCKWAVDTIAVANNASLTITDCSETVGKITHKDNVGSCSGINVKGSFTLWNGSITGNQAYQCGAVHVADSGTFTMNGGFITENATDGGVHVADSGTFTMNGGFITKNTTNSGVYVASGTFTMNGGEIAQNTNENYGGGVNVTSGTFTMTGGKITQNTGNREGGVHVSNDSTFNMKGGEITGNTNSTEYGAGGVYVNYGSTFNMTGGEISGNTNSAENGVGGVYVNYAGTFTMTGGEITGNTNTAANGGGGAYVAGAFTMTGGEITGNKSAENGGGGVYVEGDGKFTMSNGTITGNTSAGNGGGGVYVASQGTFNMNSGTITGNNTSATDNSGAGGVFMNGTFTVSGEVKIIDNWKNGQKTNNGYDKGDGTASNVYLPNDYRLITIGEGLTNNARIGVSIGELLETAGGEVQIAKGATDEQSYYRNIFSLDSEDPYYSIIRNNEYECLYIRRHKHDWKYNARGATITAQCKSEDCPVKDGDGGSITIMAPKNLIYDRDIKKATFEYKLLDEVGVKKDSIWIDYAEGSVSDNTPLGAGVVPINAGTYTASIRFEYADGTKSTPAVVEYTILKADPEAKLFYFEKPENLVYTGTDKEANVVTYYYDTDITKKYLNANGAEVEPRNVGTYTVVIDVKESRNYNAVTGLTDSGWTFTIAPVTTQPTVTLSGTTYSYTGKQIIPEEVTVKVGGMVLVKDTDYTVAYGDNKNIGKGTVTVTAVKDGNYSFAAVTKEFTIVQAEQNLSFTASKVNKTYGDPAFDHPVTGAGMGNDVIYESSDKTVATVDNNGKVTIVGAGTVTITATAHETTNYKKGTASYELTVAKATVTGAPAYTEIATGSKTLADAGLMTGSLSPVAGKLEWIDAEGNKLSDNTPVEVNTKYTWRFTPADENYDTLTGEIELYHVDMPVISAQPKDASVKIGEKAVFEVTATGEDLTYQWQIDRNDGKGFVNLDGANSASYTSGVTDSGYNGFKYRCIIGNVAGSVMTDVATLTVIEYKIIYGADSSWTQNVGGSLVIRGDGEFVDFLKVLVDGKEIAPENYTAAEGSTVITLKAEFLSTLSEGSHTFEIVWKNGSAGTHFTIARNSSGNNNGGNNNDNSAGNNNSVDNAGSGNTADTTVIAPNTGDASMDVLMVVLAVASFAGLAGMLVLKKKNE